MASLRLKTLAVIQLFVWFAYAFRLGLSFSVSTGRFDCGNGNIIPRRFLCDGDDDCRNGADERNCSQVLTGRFPCGNGKTVPRSFLCDSNNDCGNRADERNCNPENPDASETENRFDCGNGYTIPQSYQCDGDDDCRNGADERNCIRGSYVQREYLFEDDTIYSPNYPRNYPDNSKALWNVTTIPGYRIKVTFIVKELEDSRGCSADRLSLHDGHELSSPPLGVYCRHDEDELPEPAVTSSNAMLVHFSSDSTINWKGFRLALSPTCGGTLVAEQSGDAIFSHPKFGDQAYGENISCDWIIKSTPGKNVQIIFPTFDVGTASQRSDAESPRQEVVVSGCENSNTGNCVQYNTPEEINGTDFVEIYDGPDDSSTRIGKYAGVKKPPSITSRSEALLIRFRSGGHGNFRGFHAEYQEV